MVGDGGIVEPGACVVPLASVLPDDEGEGMKEIERVPLKRTTETARATGITATIGLG